MAVLKMKSPFTTRRNNLNNIFTVFLFKVENNNSNALTTCSWLRTELT